MRFGVCFFTEVNDSHFLLQISVSEQSFDSLINCQIKPQMALFKKKCNNLFFLRNPLSDNRY